MPGFIIIGNPENRRVELFQAALVRRGDAPAHVISWRSLAKEGAPERIFAALPVEPAIVRIDSFGEDFAVERAFLLRGYDDAVALGAWAEAPLPVEDRGRIFAPRQAHCGFLRVLAEVDAALASRPHLDVLNAPRSIEQLFDKRACAVTFAALGVPVPVPIHGLKSASELRAHMKATNTRQVFVKLSCGSSASCLALYDCASRAEWLFTSMEMDRANLYNSLRPRRYSDRRAIDRLLDFLLREGSHIEIAVPKAKSEGMDFDARMLVIDGSVAFTLMRKSKHPVTNLHLGGTRGTLAELEALVPPAVLAAAHESCARIAGAFDSLHLGIDVMFTEDLQGHRVLEANAFGDLLPNLERDGLDVWEWQLQAIERRLRQTGFAGIRSRTPLP